MNRPLRPIPPAGAPEDFSAPAAAPAPPPPVVPASPAAGPDPLPPPAPPPAPPPGWARPQPVRADRNLRAWLYLLAGICVLVALWVPARTIYQRLRFKPATTGPRDADSFLALAYGGVSAGKVQGPEEVSREQFRQHIQALRERGYNPIGLADVKAFYETGRRLPRKAVLVTLGQAKRSSYLETRDILRAHRWKAVMFVRADAIRNREPGALRWPILRDMARSETWDIGAESFAGFQRIPAGPAGETGNFFSTPRWFPAEKRLERPEEFLARIRADHEQMTAEFKTGMDQSPLAFAFPYGDYGQYDPRGVPTRVLNLGEVGRFYGLGFTQGPFLLNTRHTDPRILNRLRVRPDWSLEQFLDTVESGWAVLPWNLTQPLAPARWLTDWGLTEYPDGTLWLKAVSPEAARDTPFPPTTGALAWMIASDLFDDFTLRMKFRVVAGQFGLRLHALPGGEAGIRIIFDTEGHCWVNQKVYGAAEFTQAVVRDAGAAPGKIRELELSIHGRNLFALLDGEMLLKEPLDLLGDVQPGLFGLEVWDPAPGAAAAQVLSLEFPRPHHVLKQWPADPAFAPLYLMGELGRQAHRLGAVSPPWMDVVKAIPLVLPKWDEPTLRTYARIHSIRILPRIILRSAALAVQIPPELPVQEAAAMAVDGIHLDCREVAAADIATLVPWLQGVHQQTKERNMKLAIQFPAAVARLASFASIAALFPGAVIAVDTPALAPALENAGLEVLVTEEVPAPPAADMHLNLYYQLATRQLPLAELSPKARQDALRREGYLAYQDGDYGRAIASWERWLQEDPQSAEALSLIGKAHSQRGDLPRALEFFTRSLEASPGQIQLVVRRAELLEKMARDDEAREQLNLYARIFPENPDILIAQAQWLDRHRRRTEARDMVATLVREAPQNLPARVALLNLQDTPAERYQTLHGLLELARAPDARIPFGHALLEMELLTYPESGVFFDFIRTQARGRNDRQREIYGNFLPLEQPVSDDFQSGQLSDGWIASSGIRLVDRGRYELRAAVNQAETYLRLRRSELLRDGFLEVLVDESQGFFWLYARRSSRAMIRFGFDEDGFIHLQAWAAGEMLAHQVRPWVRPPGGLKMRLEVRGDGVRGFVNGSEIFDAPLGIPPEVAYGWWGIAPFAFDLGVARARILRMDCEPQPPALVLVPPGDPNAQVASLRPFVGGFSALVPAWVFQNPDGSLPAGLPAGTEVLRMFSAFHQIRLLPAIDLSYDGDIDPARVVEFIRTNRLAGAVLKRRSPAPAPWLAALAAALEEHPANVLVLQTEAALWNTPRAGEESRGEQVARPEANDGLLPKPGEKIRLRELPFGSVLIPPSRADWAVALQAPDAPPAPADHDRTAPRLYLLGPDGRLALPPPP